MKYTKAELDYFNARLARIGYLIDTYQEQSPNRILLDVGCGEGFALAYFSSKGFIVNGLDFSAAGVTQQNPKLLDLIETGDLFCLLEHKYSQSLRYDVLLLQNVLEHVIDPLKLLVLLKQLLNPGGLMLVTVPNDFSLTQQTLLDFEHIDSNFWVCPPDHLSYFTHTSLRNTLIHCGYDVKDLIADFPIDWFLFHDGSNYIKEKSKGKKAHLARVTIENMIQSNDDADVICFYRALANLGAGRDLTAIYSA